MPRICEATDDPQAIAQPEIRSLIFLTVFSHDKYRNKIIWGNSQGKNFINIMIYFDNL
jgi:hypothetical protein